jgi:hypothetical protein
MRRRWILPCVLVSATLLSSCVAARQVTTEEVTVAVPRNVATPIKIHLRNGNILIYAAGATITRDSITGTAGQFYAPTLEKLDAPRGVVLSDVIGVEAFRTSVDMGKSVGYSLISVLLTRGIIGYAMYPEGGFIKAMFGSCPTVYSDSAGVPVLETESFSYSIAPLIAKRDVDRLRVQPDANGRIRLEIRNEALETHYIDQLELLEVAHHANETVYPAPFGAPIAFTDQRLGYRAQDRAGRDVATVIARADSLIFATADQTLAAATDSDPLDHIDLVFARPAADSIALALRMRSSLLTTLLFYEYMLHRPGPAALDWLANDMARIATIAEFGRWYGANMGLRVQVWRDGRYEQVARLADFGPIAYRHVALMIPAGSDDSVRVRLEFTADQWRIDELALAPGRRVATSKVPLAGIVTPLGDTRADMTAQLMKADERDVSTVAGERFFADFMTAPAATPRTFLLAAQGYYTEWIRGEWLKTATDGTAFDPARVRMGELLAEWRAQKPAMEASFFSSKVKPVL